MNLSKVIGRLLFLALAVGLAPAVFAVAISTTLSPVGPIAVGSTFTVTFEISGYASAEEIDGFEFMVTYPTALFSFVGLAGATHDGSAFAPAENWLRKPPQDGVGAGPILTDLTTMIPGTVNISVADLRGSSTRGTTAASGFLVSFDLVANAVGTGSITASAPLSGVTLSKVDLTPAGTTPTFSGASVTVVPLFTVTNTNDSGLGSLRQAVADAAAFTNAVINFAPGLSGQAITLANEIVVSNTNGVTIDASALPAGITIDGGPGTNRILAIDSAVPLTLTGLTLSGGGGAGAQFSGLGGAIRNSGGTLTLDRCTLTGNSSTSSGGAIYNAGPLVMTRCTLSGNSSPGGGALANYVTATLTHCTVSGNAATGNGGGIDNGNGAGIVLTLANSIVAGNTAGTGADINNFNGTVTRVGANLVQGYTGIAATGSGTISTADPLLAPLDNYGGPTRTMALILGSPARNASVGSTITGDQRGFPIVGTADIGAYEAGTFTNYNAFIWETLPANATVAQHAASFDYDGDGAINSNEWIALTNPADPTSLFRIVNLVPAGSNVDLTFTTVVGRHYTIEYGTDLVSWTPIGGSFVGTGSPITTFFGPVTGFPRLFMRARVGP